MPEMNQLTRALRILQLLLTHDGLTVAQLHERLEQAVSKRTIQRTLQSLEEAHVPLVRSAGPHGQHRISLRRGFDFVPAVLTADEALAAILLGRYSEHFAGGPVGEMLVNVVEKLEQLLPVDSLVANHGLLGLDDALGMREPGKVSAPPSRQLVDMLDAILRQRVCHVVYTRLDSNEAREFDVEPYSIIFSGGAIYALCRHPVHENFLHLALQRLRSVTATGQPFTRDPEFNLAEFLNGAFGIWREDPVAVRIRFNPRVASFLKERVWHPTQVSVEHPDGSLELSFRVGLSPELTAWILRWGEFAEVLEPQELRTRLATRLQAAALQYLRPV